MTHEQTSEPTTKPMLCRVLGCRWRYRAQGAALHGECARRCGRRASHTFRREEDAARLARYLGRQETPAMEGVLKPVARLVDGRRGVRPPAPAAQPSTPVTAGR